MADCKNMNCPFRANDSTNKYRCECFACERRWNGSTTAASNRTEMGGIETGAETEQRWAEKKKK